MGLLVVPANSRWRCRQSRWVRVETYTAPLVEAFWKWVGRTADVIGISGVGVALIVGAVVGAELEFRRASAVWKWTGAVGAVLVVAAAIRWLLRWWRNHFDSLGGERFAVRKRVRLADLVGHDCIIRDITFEDCEIHGPMVVMSTGKGVGFFDDNCTWDGNQGAVFITATRPKVGGVVGLENCIFRRCRLYNVAIMISESALIPEWTQGMGIAGPEEI